MFQGLLPPLPPSARAFAAPIALAWALCDPCVKAFGLLNWQKTNPEQGGIQAGLYIQQQVAKQLAQSCSLCGFSFLHT